MTVINGSTGIDKVQNDAVNPVTDIASGIPCFSAYQSVAQSIGAYTSTVINFQTVEFDSTGAYNNTTMRFTPQVAGYYQISASASSGTSSNTATSVGIWKNNSVEKNGCFTVGTSVQYTTGTVSAIVYLNGSTDYIQVKAYLGQASTLSNVKQDTYFQAHLIVGA